MYSTYLINSLTRCNFIVVSSYFSSKISTILATTFSKHFQILQCCRYFKLRLPSCFLTINRSTIFYRIVFHVRSIANR